MNDNDLSDEAINEYVSEQLKGPGEYTRPLMIRCCKEWRRRAQANPWQFHSDEELKDIAGWIFECSKLGEAIAVELSRRKGGK